MNSHDIRRYYNEELGIPFTTACARLRRNILFDLIKKVNLDVCFRCGKVIETPEELGIDHKEAWIGVDTKLFWDLNNVTFSHIKCNNSSEKYLKRKMEDGCEPLIGDE